MAVFDPISHHLTETELRNIGIIVDAIWIIQGKQNEFHEPINRSRLCCRLQVSFIFSCIVAVLHRPPVALVSSPYCSSSKNCHAAALPALDVLTLEAASELLTCCELSLVRPIARCKSWCFVSDGLRGHLRSGSMTKTGIDSTLVLITALSEASRCSSVFCEWSCQRFMVMLFSHAENPQANHSCCTFIKTHAWKKKTDRCVKQKLKSLGFS